MAYGLIGGIGQGLNKVADNMQQNSLEQMKLAAQQDAEARASERAMAMQQNNQTFQSGQTDKTIAANKDAAGLIATTRAGEFDAEMKLKNTEMKIKSAEEKRKQDVFLDELKVPKAEQLVYKSYDDAIKAKQKSIDDAVANGTYEAGTPEKPNVLETQLEDLIGKRTKVIEPFMKNKPAEAAPQFSGDLSQFDKSKAPKPSSQTTQPAGSLPINTRKGRDVTPYEDKLKELMSRQPTNSASQDETMAWQAELVRLQASQGQNVGHF